MCSGARWISPAPPDFKKPSGSESSPEGEGYFEFRPIGNAVRVSAIDAGTGTEVVVMGPRLPTSTILNNWPCVSFRSRFARDAVHDGRSKPRLGHNPGLNPDVPEGRSGLQIIARFRNFLAPRQAHSVGGLSEGRGRIVLVGAIR